MLGLRRLTKGKLTYLDLRPSLGKLDFRLSFNPPSGLNLSRIQALEFWFLFYILISVFQPMGAVFM